MTKAKILFVLFISLNFMDLFGQQSDTVVVNNYLPPLKVVSTIDTIMLNQDYKVYIVRISINSLKNNDFIQEIIETTSDSFFIKNISYEDINLDNHKDIKVAYENQIGMLNNSYFIYDFTINQFVVSNDFNRLHDPYLIDKEKKVIFDSTPWYPGIYCTTNYKYQISGLKLILLEEDGCFRYGSNNDNYVSYTKKLIENKFITVSLDSIIHVKNNYLIKTYSFINDNLLLSSINDKEVKGSNSDTSKIYYSSEFTGRLKCLRKEVFNYSIDSQGKLKCEVDKYTVENNKWEKIL